MDGIKPNRIDLMNDISMADAPMSIKSGYVLPDIDSLDLSFRPHTSLLSDLTLPNDLPLHSIAGSYLFIFLFHRLTPYSLVI